MAPPPNWDAQPLPSWLGFLCQEKKDVDFSSAVNGWAHSFPLDGWVKIRRKGSFPPKSSDACLLLLLFTLDAFEGFVLFWVFLLLLFCLLRQLKKVPLVVIRQSQEEPVEWCKRVRPGSFSPGGSPSIPSPPLPPDGSSESFKGYLGFHIRGHGG